MTAQISSPIDVQTEIQKALNEFFKALRRLRELSITPNSKDITCQLGEWLVEQLYDGQRSTNGIQRDWDVRLKGGSRIQVKSHAKAPTTNARWSQINYDLHAQVDELVIIVFDQKYQIKEFYKAPWHAVLPRIRRHADKDRIFWDDLKEFNLALNDVPNQDVLVSFR